MNTPPPLEQTAGPGEARRRLAATFRKGELVWLAGEQYDPELGFWDLEVLRAGSFGRWMRQRYRFDEAADVLYFLGETQLDDAAFRAARNAGAAFPAAST